MIVRMTRLWRKHYLPGFANELGTGSETVQERGKQAQGIPEVSEGSCLHPARPLT